jgi:hypothetical protein
MSINRWMNLVLAILVVIWGGLSVDAARQQLALTEPTRPVTQNSPIPCCTTPQVQQSAPTPSPSLNVVQPHNTPKPTSSAEAAVRNLFAGRVASPTPTSTPSPSSAPTASSNSSPVATATPVAQVSYKIQGGGVFYEGALDAAGLSVGEATKRIAAHHGISFTYNATPLGWFVTELAGVTQNPAQDKYWLYWVNGAFGDVSADKKILQPGDSLIWQYGGE